MKRISGALEVSSPETFPKTFCSSLACSMPSPSHKSHGPDVQARVKCLLEAILEEVSGERELVSGLVLKSAWSEDGKRLTIETTLRSLVLLSQPALTANTSEFKRVKAQAGESLIDLRDFLGILDDHRVITRGSDKWHFSLQLWGRDTARNLAEFDKLWESKRSPTAKPTPAPETQPKPRLKPGAPFPRVRLPDNFVERPDALKAVKEKLLVESDRTLVVSAIAGLGGLGKSVLATALVLDGEVQERFVDGILWVTLGQSPDLQTMLGEWIRELDKSREAFSANTLESASRYLDNLLAERQMLLVVDDVWNSADAEWFQVGGAGCRVLVTTREAQIDGAEYYSLSLMSEAEAINLVRRKLKRQWQSNQEAEVKAFVKVVGYLPLALDLAANQVRDGLTWVELRAEFEAERKSIALGTGRRSSALKLLDSLEKWDELDENQQRKYSLQACFNLSLKRLSLEQLQQFAWLGVLPEDVNLNQQVASVLWDLPSTAAKRVLILLRKRSFFTDGVTTIEGERTYRVHDLMHDMARGLIEEGTLNLPIQKLSAQHGASSKSQNLPLAHRLFLEHYREQAIDRRWDRLPNDGYIHRHLTWHMEQANWADEIHGLIAMSDELGRNAWFEACDRIGKPAIFVEDVARGWRIAEQTYEQEQTKAIVLQCRYALITATLNSLISNLPIDMMAEFVKRKFWTVEQAWAYVEQMHDEWRIARAIQALSPHLSKTLFRVALRAARMIQDESGRAEVLASLAKLNPAYFSEALEAVRAIRTESGRAEVLASLAKLNPAYFSEALEAVRAIQDEFSQAKVLASLAELNTADFTALLEAARAIQDESNRAWVLRDLTKLNTADFTALLEAARAIQDESNRAWVLRDLTKLDPAYFSEALEAARAIQDKSSHAEVLVSLAKLDPAYFSEALEAARAIRTESGRAEVLVGLAKLDPVYFSEALEAARAIRTESGRAEVLVGLAKLDPAYFSEALEAARAIQDEFRRAEVLVSLAKLNTADFTALLETVRVIQDKSSHAEVLASLAKLDPAYFSEALEAARAIQDESRRTEVFCNLAKLDTADFTTLLEAARAIQNESGRAWVLSDLAKLDTADFTTLLEAARLFPSHSGQAEVLATLAKLDPAYFPEALEAAQAIQNESGRAEVLASLAKLNPAYFPEALEAAQAIQNESGRAEVLASLAKLNTADCNALLEAARAIQDESGRAEVLASLARLNPAYFPEALEAAQAIQDESGRAEVLASLARLNPAYFPEALEAARAIQDESRRAWVLRNLAKLDPAYFPEALEAAQAIQDESGRAEVLASLAKLNPAYFSEALEAARAVQDESRRAWVLRNLAKLYMADCNALLEAARGIQNESRRAEVLCNLARQAPQSSLLNLWYATLDLTHKPTCAGTLSNLLSRFSLATLPYSDWQTYLHLLAHRRRSDLMQDFVTLYPAIVRLGGKAAMHGVVAVVSEVCGQWK
jgi:biotin synthase-like enzyme